MKPLVVLGACLTAVPLAYLATTVATTAWYHLVYLPRINGED